MDLAETLTQTPPALDCRNFELQYFMTHTSRQHVSVPTIPGIFSKFSVIISTLVHTLLENLLQWQRQQLLQQQDLQQRHKQLQGHDIQVPVTLTPFLLCAPFSPQFSAPLPSLLALP